MNGPAEVQARRRAIARAGLRQALASMWAVAVEVGGPVPEGWKLARIARKVARTGERGPVGSGGAA